MIADYEDDDAHFCLKCHVTVIGLDNYISHRKRTCGTSNKTLLDIQKSPPSSTLLTQDDSFNLKADDFFSSLELQSSNKKATSGPSTSGKTWSGILTRSKTSAAIQAASGSSVVNKDDLPQSKSGKNAWIGGHQLKELGSGDNQTKLIKAVDNLSRNSCIKKDEEEDIQEEYHENSDDESDESEFDEDDDDEEEVPRNYTGGKWMPQWNVSGSAATGGKWKPAKARLEYTPPQNHTKGKWKPGSPYNIPSTSNASPPVNYTGGKWKPIKQEDEFPPPSHTKGKWKPCQEEKKMEEPLKKKRISEENRPFRKANGSVQYWCNTCNRRLASKIVYQRHLKSVLHYKRTLQEAEFDDSSHLNTNLDKESKRTIHKPVEYWSHTTTATAENNEDTMKNTMTAGKRMRRKIYAKCEVCRSRVTSLMMGKHLISHYHCRKGDISTPEARKMVLDNIHNIVLQSPYQCGACKFYCNTQNYFLRHWNTRRHIETIESTRGIIWCTFCKFSCSSTENQTMYEHLISPEHDEVISVINRSVPLIIRKITPVECQTCHLTFILNVQLRKHCEAEGHPYCDTATDEYQQRSTCSICHKVLHSTVALQRHIKRHEFKMFFCSQCSATFSTFESISKHRKTHKQPKFKDSKKCLYCEASFTDKQDYKEHLKDQHPEHSYDCPHCGAKFSLSQELTTHLRMKACRLQETSRTKARKCNLCSFSCDALSELLFHKALHGDCIQIESSNRRQPLYKCAFCGKYFPKSSLRYHLQNHTNEKTFECDMCGAKFARKNNWIYHLKKHKDVEFRGNVYKTCTEKNFLCSTCGAKFSSNSTLRKHMMIHNGKPFKCPEPGCIYSSRTAADLKVHRASHSDQKSFECDLCDYKGKSKQQLKRHTSVHDYVKKYRCSQCSFTCRLAFQLRRHERVHTGSKPFQCVHCDYRCNNMENLRKHVLSTNKHPGKCIYECKFCDVDVDNDNANDGGGNFHHRHQFQTNFAKDFKVHLISQHGDVFGSTSEAAGYISTLYGSSDFDTFPPPQITYKEEAEDEEDDGNEINPTMFQLVDENNVSVATLIQPSQEITFEHKDHEMFSMYVVPKDHIDKDAWSMELEAGALVSFSEDPENDALFHEHFQ